MDTRHVPQPFRARVKRAQRKLRAATARQIVAGGPSFGASMPALRAMRRAALAAGRVLNTFAPILGVRECDDVGPCDLFPYCRCASRRPAGMSAYERLERSGDAF